MAKNNHFWNPKTTLKLHKSTKIPNPTQFPHWSAFPIYSEFDINFILFCGDLTFTTCNRGTTSDASWYVAKWFESIMNRFRWEIAEKTQHDTENRSFYWFRILEHDRTWFLIDIKITWCSNHHMTDKNFKRYLYQRRTREIWVRNRPILVIQKFLIEMANFGFEEMNLRVGFLGSFWIKKK